MALARAGKVKSQTPLVPKGTPPRPPTGKQTRKVGAEPSDFTLVSDSDALCRAFSTDSNSSLPWRAFPLSRTEASAQA